MYSAIAVASASSTHCTSAWSIIEPGGGAPGRISQAAAGGVWTQGTGKAFKGGVGTGAKGNDGTTTAVKDTEGENTYNELSYAME
ncbi:MAG: phosphate transport system substrate-binding protein [Mycobacterium sp.]|nr:phosphate transport system substrate-binding protein [Mycobacterium sp.]